MGQSYADTKTVKNFAENFDARGLQNTASVVVSGYKADMNPTVYVQAANDIFEAAYAKVPMAAVGKINYYSKYVPMGTLETIYEAALTDRLANDARTRGRLKGVVKASKGVEESSKSVANTAQSVAQSSKTVERGNENGGRGNGREHGTNDERGEIRISGERRGQTVQDSGRKGRSMEEGTGRTEENGRPGRYGRAEKENAGDVFKEAVTAKSLGIEGGTETGKAYILDESRYDDDIKALKEELGQFGLDVVAFEGSLTVENVGRVRGVISGNTVYVKTDAYRYNAYQIGMHEFFHAFIRESAKAEGISRELAVTRLWNRIVDLYDDDAEFENLAFEVYEKLYKDTGYSRERIIEEMLCDMFASMNELELFNVSEVFSQASQKKFYKSARRLMDIAGESLAAELRGSEYFDGFERQAEAGNSGVIRFSKESYVGKAIVKQLRDSEAELNKMQVVDDVFTDSVTGKSTSRLAEEYSKKCPAIIDRKGFGNIVFDKNRINKGFNYLNLKTEKAAVMAVPRVLKRGIEIESHKDHKGRGQIDSFTFAAPITIDGIRHNMGVVVQRDPSRKNRYHALRVILPTGAVIEFTDSENETAEATTAGGPASFEGGGTTITSADTEKISQSNKKSKKNFSDSEPRFSMETEYEAKGSLLAMHNLTADKLEKSLDLGGLAMPSIAVTKADIPHTNFGDITLVMNKSAIDPESDARNKVYSADAWTPTFPKIEYEVNEKAASKIRDLYYEVFRKYGNDIASPFYSAANTPEDFINRKSLENIKEDFKKNTEAMNFYLAATGKEPVKTIEKTIITKTDESKIKGYEAVLDVLGEDIVSKLLGYPGFIGKGGKLLSNNEEKTRAAAEAYYSAVFPKLKERNIKRASEQNIKEIYSRIIRPSLEYERNGRKAETVKTEQDYEATQKAIREAVDKKAYDKWIDDLFKGIIKREGIYNNKDYYTASGNRRSFDQLHYDVTLENIVKAMKGQGEGNSKNASGVFVGAKTLRAELADTFKSIPKMHEREGSLQNLSEEETAAINDEFQNRTSDVIAKIYNSRPHGSDENYFVIADSIGSVLAEAAEKKKYSATTIGNTFKQYGYNISLETAKEIKQLFDDIKNMPVYIFEAKPERVVSFDEALAAVVPEGTDTNLVEKLKDAGVKEVLTYEPDNVEDRLEKVNSVDEARFSIETTEEGYKYVNLDADTSELQGLKGQKLCDKVEEIINRRFTGKILGRKEGTAVVEAKSGAHEYANSEKYRLYSLKKRAKFSAAYQLDELLEASYFIEHIDRELVKKDHPEAENGIDHYEVFFRFGDNYMKGMITVLDQKNVRTFYDLSRIENVRAIGIHPSEEGGRPPANILDYYITRENEYRKKNFQKKDSNDTRTSRETYTNISLERFKELEKNNKALEKRVKQLRKRTEHFKAELRQTPKAIKQNPLLDMSVCRKIADRLESGLGLVFDEKGSITYSELVQLIYDMGQANFQTDGWNEETTQKANETIDVLAKKAMEAAMEDTNEYLNEGLDKVKSYLKRSKIYVSPKLRAGVADFGKDYVKKYAGRIIFTYTYEKAYVNVEDVYSELNGMAPGLFPDEIINPLDQLDTILAFVDGMEPHYERYFDNSVETFEYVRDYAFIGFKSGDELCGRIYRKEC